MATNNTSETWFWYVRKKGRNWVLGIVDDEGDAPTSALTIDYWYDEIPDEITSDDETLPIPAQFEHGFAMGCVYELMRMKGKEVPTFKRDFEKAIYDAIHTQVDETQQPLAISPIDLRMDDSDMQTQSPLL